MKGSANRRSTGLRPGDTNVHACQRMTGRESTSPPTIATSRGIVTSSVGLVMIGLEIRWLGLARRLVRGYSSTLRRKWLKTAATTVAAAHAESETMRSEERRVGKEC